MIYKLVLGDWSEDGHGRSKDFLFDCNYDVHKIRQAYKDSCKKLGITFNRNENYTGIDLNYDDERMVWTDYGENEISKFAFDILNESKCFRDVEYDELDGNEITYEVYDMNDCAKLIMNFIALSLPKDFKYTLVEEEHEPINGYWNDELNVQFGYGLFDD